MDKAKVFYGTGRRKTAVARVWMMHGQKGFTVNGQAPADYLKRSRLLELVERPLKTSKLEDQFRIRAKVHGGGIAGQAGAIQLGISGALVQYDENLRPGLRKESMLTRDPREKERKKAGRRGARRSFQYTKR